MKDYKRYGSRTKSGYKSKNSDGSRKISDKQMLLLGYYVIACYYNKTGRQVRCWESKKDSGMVVRIHGKGEIYTIHYENRKQAIRRLQIITKPEFTNGGYVRDRKKENEYCAEQACI